MNSEHLEAFKQFYSFTEYGFGTDTKNGAFSKLSIDETLRKRFIKLNSPWQYSLMVIDYDKESVLGELPETEMPIPNWQTFNPVKNTSQFGYLLSSKIQKADYGGSVKAEKYFTDVWKKLNIKFGDPAFTRDRARSPFATPSEHLAQFYNFDPHDLRDLAKLVHGVQIPSSRDVVVIDQSRRNNSLRAKLAQEGCKIRFNYREDEDRTQWTADIQKLALALNDYIFDFPLPRDEVVKVARSVSKHLWETLIPEELSLKQSVRAKARWNKVTYEIPGRETALTKDELNLYILTLKDSGYSAKEIAAKVGLTPQNVNMRASRARKELNIQSTSYQETLRSLIQGMRKDGLTIPQISGQLNIAEHKVKYALTLEKASDND